MTVAWFGAVKNRVPTRELRARSNRPAKALSVLSGPVLPPARAVF
jgi:hypothetical protein